MIRMGLCKECMDQAENTSNEPDYVKSFFGTRKMTKIIYVDQKDCDRCGGI